MTHPLTPREKVAVFESCPGCGADEPINRCLGCRHDFSPGNRQAILDSSPLAALTALASGSGDHAELGNRLRASKRNRHGIYGRVLVNPDGPAAAAALEALLAENAALRGERDALDLALGVSKMMVNDQDHRATEAERKLAEAVGLLGDVVFVRKDNAGRSAEYMLSEVITKARTYLSKEAERG
ncbi:hypothetical protein [Brevundimonas diminuta]|uniref:hypothetical protein n=1 Tax=Brevundimonas diminuta TaxID=293 RepID=UPI0011781630|nr:hypothetical protein [Brevundimonas diminuta]